MLSIMLMLVLCLDPVAVPVFMSCDMMSMGTGNTMVLLFSAEMLFSVCRYLSCRGRCISVLHIYSCDIHTCSAAGLSIITSAACLRALLALCSHSAAITLALASLAASASAAMARCSCSGTRTSFTSTLSTATPQGSVASSRVALRYRW